MTVSTPQPQGVRPPLLSLRGISKSFGAINALTDISLDIYPGEVVALLGDNGAGKSTLVKILAGVHAADSGSITFAGREVTIDSPTESRRLGIATVFQDLALCDNLDIVANLFLGREEGRFTLEEESMERSAWSLLRSLSAKIASVRVPIASLSGGQRQTVAIARSLIGDPQLVMLDEPTASLGVAQTAEVLALVRRLRERGHGVLLITHNMGDVQQVCDRAAILRLGRNNGIYDLSSCTTEDIISAITGATDATHTKAVPA